jgi:hypothetical protein
MTWDEISAKHLEEIYTFKAKALVELERLKKDPEFTAQIADEFRQQQKLEREALHKRQMAEFEQHLDRKQYKDRYLAYLKRMAYENPENEYWAEAVERMEVEKKKELEQEKERKRAQSRERER